MRKHLRNLRLENVTQLGNLDRVVDFRFGSGTHAHHVLLELYAQGNVILCDGEYRILALLRTHQYEVVAGGGNADVDDVVGKKKGAEDAVMAVPSAGTDEVKVRVGAVYPVTFATTLTDERGGPSGEGGVGRDGGCAAASSRTSNAGLLAMDGPEAYEWARAELSTVQKKALAAAAGGNDDRNPIPDDRGGGGGKGRMKGGKKKKAMDDSLVLKALLLRPNSGVYHYGPSLIEHCVLTAGFDPVMKLTHDNIEYTLPDASWAEIIAVLRCEGNRVIQNLISGEGGGYILYKPKASTDIAKDNVATNDGPPLSLTMANANPHSDKTLLEFQPHLLHQHRDQRYLKFSTFTMAADEFFSNLSSQRITARADAAEASARDRLARIQADQQRRVEGLVREQERLRDSAQLVETHAGDVDRALGVINSALETGMDWDTLEQLVTVEQGNDNPIALLIHKLLLDKDQVVLALPDVEGWDDSVPDSAPPIQHVTVSIKESAHGNARAMFAAYRAVRGKEEKTVEASTTALKAAESKARQQLAEAQKKKQQVQVLPQRKTYWFEKFAWFITSDNYLVLAGKDAQQNEQLVKRYLRPGDAYLHAEVHGAATCILRAKRRRRVDGKTQVVPLSDQALREAGTFTICRSAAWSSKMVTSAYWVESHQVSKTAPTGEYLTVGSFMIRGKKNFLPPSSLEMGLGVAFRLGDEASIARHANERRDFALLEQEQSFSQHEGEFEDKEEQRQPKLILSSLDESDGSEIGVENLAIVDNSDVFGEKDVNPSRESEYEHMLSPGAGDAKRSETDVPKASSSAIEDKHVSFLTDTVSPQETRKKENELSRGKRSKVKRAKKRYGEQDDEDRELVMLALHAGESKKKDKKEKGSRVGSDSATQKRATKETLALLIRDSQAVAETLDENVKESLAKCVTVKVTKGSDSIRWSKFDADVLEQLREMENLNEQQAAANRLLELSNATRIDNFSASLAGIIRAIKKHGVTFQSSNDITQAGDGKQRKSKIEKQVEKEAWKDILAEDGILDIEGDDEDNAVDDTVELLKLTGKPMVQDSILWAIPVCAPYSVLSKYTYRVKLTPGSVKRGKASKQAVEIFLRGETGVKKTVDDSTKRDLALIKLVNENDWVQAMIGDVRIASAGASKAMTKVKSKGKAKK
jgi:predicted ribosome quality control (RQC) complex YloA/Tae2 family protein